MRCRIGITIELLYIVIQRPTLYKQFLAAAAAARASARRTVRQATGREDVATAHGAATHQAEANKLLLHALLQAKQEQVLWSACPTLSVRPCHCLSVCLSEWVVYHSGRTGRVSPAWHERSGVLPPQPQLQVSSEQKKKGAHAGSND